MARNDKNKLMWIDIMKGILIVLMVLGHAYVKYTEFIYLFHMAVFFMISGYCWSEKHSNDIESVKHYIVQRIIRLYIPFVLINVVYILLNNYFINIGFYSNSQDFLALTNGAAFKQHLTKYYTIPQIVKNILRTMCFGGGAARMCGPTWFLSTMFMVSVFHCIFSWIIGKLKLNKTVVFSIVMLICLVCAWLFDHGFISTLGGIERLQASYAAYIAGILLRTISETEKYTVVIDYNKKITVFASIFLPLIVLIVFYSMRFYINLSKAEITNPLGYIVVSVCGWAFIKGISIFLSNFKLSTIIFQLLGTRTIPILLFHTLSFKIISLLYIKTTGESMLLLASYPVIFATAEWMRYIYLIVGIIVPLGMYQIFFIGKNIVVSNIKKLS